MYHEIIYDSVVKKNLSSVSHLMKGQGAVRLISGVPAYRYQQSLSRCITCQDVCIQQSHAAKRLIS